MQEEHVLEMVAVMERAARLRVQVVRRLTTLMGRRPSRLVAAALQIISPREHTVQPPSSALRPQARKSHPISMDRARLARQWQEVSRRIRTPSTEQQINYLQKTTMVLTR